jgi:hypothetical protein
MIPPQLALLAAKHGKKLAIGLVILVVIAGVYFAVKMHERTVAQLAASEAARAAQVVAHETTLASLEVRKEAAARWQASAEKYQETLNVQERVREMASEESRRIEETLGDDNLERLGRAQPEVLERTVNRDTARVIRLLNCSSTPRGCDGDRGASGPSTSDSVPATTVTRSVPVDLDGAGSLARPRQTLLLSRFDRVRSSGT